MCGNNRYKITVTIGRGDDVIDGGGWTVGMTWRKSMVLEPGERDRALALRDMLNAKEPALDPLGYPMWDHGYGMCNTQCWQWEVACRHSSCVNDLMAAAGIDDWPADGTPDVDMPAVSINLAIY